MTPLKLHWGELFVEAVATLRIVEQLDIVKDVRTSFCPRRVCLAANPFPLQQLKETLSYGVVVEVAPSAHAWHKAVSFQKVLPIVTGELTTLI